MNAAVGTRSTARSCARDRAPARPGLDDLAERSAHGDLADAGVRRATAHRAEIVPGDSSVPTARNQSAAFGEAPGHVRERLDVVDERRRRVGAASAPAISTWADSPART